MAAAPLEWHDDNDAIAAAPGPSSVCPHPHPLHCDRCRDAASIALSHVYTTQCIAHVLLQVFFKSNGIASGGEVAVYLLEKHRVIEQVGAVRIERWISSADWIWHHQYMWMRLARDRWAGAELRLC